MIVLLSPYPPPHISGVIQFGGGGGALGEGTEHRNRQLPKHYI